MSIFFLIFSGILINGVHGYLLFSQRHDRKWSLSHHAIVSRKTHNLHIFGHTLGGLLFVIFAKQFFVDSLDLDYLFYLCLLTYFFEIWQAILPTRGKYEVLHVGSALAMWVSFITVGLISIFAVDLHLWSWLVAIGLYFVLLSMFVRAMLHRSRLYFYQMCMVMLFYISMLVIVIGGK